VKEYNWFSGESAMEKVRKRRGRRGHRGGRGLRGHRRPRGRRCFLKAGNWELQAENCEQKTHTWGGRCFLIAENWELKAENCELKTPIFAISPASLRSPVSPVFPHSKKVLP